MVRRRESLNCVQAFVRTSSGVNRDLLPSKSVIRAKGRNIPSPSLSFVLSFLPLRGTIFEKRDRRRRRFKNLCGRTNGLFFRFSSMKRKRKRMLLRGKGRNERGFKKTKGSLEWRISLSLSLKLLDKPNSRDIFSQPFAVLLHQFILVHYYFSLSIVSHTPTS